MDAKQHLRLVKAQHRPYSCALCGLAVAPEGKLETVAVTERSETSAREYIVEHQVHPDCAAFFLGVRPRVAERTPRRASR